jgi:hypothetical protein
MVTSAAFLERKPSEAQAAGGVVLSSEINASVSGRARSRIWRRILAKAIRILAEKKKMIAVMTPNNTAKTWNSMPPVFGSIYIQPPKTQNSIIKQALMSANRGSYQA